MNLSLFAERLSDLIFDSGKNSREIAKEIGIGKSTIYEYLSANKMPTLQNLIKLADYFGCSIDFLFGQDDYESKGKFITPAPFPARFKEMLDYFNISRYKLEKLTGISESVLYYWAKGDKTPSIESIVHVCEVLDCSIDFFIGRTNLP